MIDSRWFLWLTICTLLLTANYEMSPVKQGKTFDVWSYALPFTRVLHVVEPNMEGRDVVILQNLLRRSSSSRGIELKATGFFDNDTQRVLQSFQEDEELTPADGVLNPLTAFTVLKKLMNDKYRDDGSIPEGVKFKLHIPVYRDRTIETNATLYNSKGDVLHRFLVRTHGSNGTEGQTLNQLTRNGNTPTGLTSMDLNTPEPIVKSFGPYPVLRFVKGIKGNSAIGRDGQVTRDTFLSNYRSGILIHTGKWDDWDAGKPMPNSNGCVHAHPEDQKKITDILLSIGVTANENPYGKLPYPFKAQGIVSVEQID